MTEKNSPPGIAQDLLRIHRVITRGLSVAWKKGEEYLQAGFPEAAIQKGFADYTQSLTIVLGAHHLAEDEVAFPSLREKLPSAPYERLSRNHQEIEALIESIRKGIPAVEQQGQPDCLAALLDGLRKATAIWGPHIRMEERYFSREALAEVMSQEEQGRLSAAMAWHSQEHSNPGYLALPFVLFNLEAEDRAAMAATLPGSVVEELIPKAWKDQWAFMKPFLLE